MQSRFLPRSTLPAILLIVPAYIVGGACGSDDHQEDDGGNPALADVIYEGGTNDEALEVLLAATPKDDPAKKAVFDAPADQASLPATPPAEFSWATATAQRARPSMLRWAALDPSQGTQRPAVRPLAELAALLGPIREAHAHGAPINGTAYFLTFTAGGASLLRVFTTSTSYAPDEAAWGKLSAADGEISASLVTAIFENNAIPADGGPFQGGTIRFTIQP